MKTLSIYPKNENINSRKGHGPLRSFLFAVLLSIGLPVISYALPESAPVYVHGIGQTLMVCENSGTTSINSLLSITDADAGQTETWTVSSFPAHGHIVTGPTQLSTGGTNTVTPTGFSYRPNTGFSGTDVFTIQVSDNFLSTTTTVTVTVNQLPSIETFTGGGGYCAASGGVSIGLTLTEAHVTYQLYMGATAVGSAVSGTGSAITFGMDTTGVYHAIATNDTSLCTTFLSGVTASVNPQPDTFTMTGGGEYCTNGAGVHVGLTGSAIGINYQLYNDNSGSPVTVGSPVAGTGSALDFGLQTLGDNYTAIATNASTGCTENMASSVAITLLPLPDVFSVTGGGTYCLFGSSVTIGLDGSQSDATYQVYYIFGASGGAVAGTGSALTLGTESIPSNYTVIATSTVNSCTVAMTGGAMVNFSLPPIPGLVTADNGGNYCAGDSGVHVHLNTSATGVSYQIYRNDTAVGTVIAGTGNALDFGLFDTVGTYKITGTNGGAGCTSNMLNTVIVAVAPVLIPGVTVSTGLGAGNAVCYGSLVTFTAQTTNGGTTPTYAWTVNGTTVGTADDTLNYSPVDGDVVAVKLNSNAMCAKPDTAINAMTINADTAAVPSVFILATAVDIAIGQQETLTAIPTNGGPAPTYQWYINGNVVPGATNAVYTSNNFSNHDSVCVSMTSSGGCGGVTTFNCVNISLFHTGVNQAGMGNGVKLIPNPNKGDFTISGTIGSQTNEEVSVEITNMLGQVIYTNKVTAQNGTLNERIQLNNSLPNGMYLLNLKSANESNVLRFVIAQ